MPHGLNEDDDNRRVIQRLRLRGAMLRACAGLPLARCPGQGPLSPLPMAGYDSIEAPATNARATQRRRLWGIT